MQQPLLNLFSEDNTESIQNDLMGDDIPYCEVESLLEDFLQKELERFQLIDIVPIDETDANVKWKYSSALQKSIRRGYVEDAIRYALVFHTVDATAFWTRLVVIAFEDIGLGGVWELALTLVAARSKIWRKRVGGDVKVIHYIIKALAESVKDRSACDMMISLWNCPRKPKVLNALKTASSSELSGIALSERNPTSFRASAAWLLWGTDKLENKHLPLRAGSKDMFRSTIEQMKVPALVKYVTLRGMTACRFPMNLLYPFIWAMMQKSQYYRLEKSDLPSERFYIGGLPEESLDQYVREGKRALAIWGETCSPVYHWLKCKGILTRDARIAAIGAAVFITEGAKLDRRLDFEGASDIFEAAERIDYQNVGLSLEDGRTLAKMVEENYDVLRQARIRALSGK